MICRKCNSQNAYCSSWGVDIRGFAWETWFCPDCGHSHTIRRKVDGTKLPDKIEINGIEYRKVEK